MPYKNPELHKLNRKEYARKWYLKNKDRLNTGSKIYFYKNKEKLHLAHKKYYLKNKEKIKVKHAQQYINTREIKRDKWYKRTYGISWEDKQRMIQSQEGRCMICKESFISEKTTHVDHDHKTGKIRDILCDTCNNGIGKFKDNIELMQNAINYLLKWRD